MPNKKKVVTVIEFLLKFEKQHTSHTIIENCLDRHAEANPDKPAIIWEKDNPGEEEVISYRCVCNHFL